MAKDELGNTVDKTGTISKYAALPKIEKPTPPPKIEKTPEITKSDIEGASTSSKKSFNIPKIQTGPLPGNSKMILIGGFIIISFGAVYAWQNKKPETPVLAGGIAFVLLASLLDALGGGLSRIATGLVGLAVTTVVIVEAPALFQAINNTKNARP